ncbi:MAG: aminotransferase class V-fold PLP-dependent enzyme [Synergistaceae bacterium]|jgi:cysteine desulfurase family protein|nr:aminotransferase class V-fold PLP-dependent enzyme [Synergistaceae bacterium]
MSIYLNNAATTWPKPPCVPDAIYDFIANRGANVARGSASMRDIQSLDNVFTCRQKLAELFDGYQKCDPRFITLTSNVTESINMIIKGFLKPGMRAVTSSMEHNSVLRPLRRAENEGVALDIIQCSLKGYLDPALLKKNLSGGADIAIINHCSNVSGSLQNIQDIAEVCRASNVPLVVDCAQTAGIIGISAQALGAAALCFTGHKGLFGPQGTGGIVWDPEFAKICSPLFEGGTGSISHEEFQPSQMPDKFEAGTPNLPGIAGLIASLEWIENEGIDKIRKHEDRLGKMLEEGLMKINGLRIIGPGSDDPRLPVYSVNIKGMDNAKLARDLSDIYGIETRPGLHCAPLAHRTLGTFPEGALRISPGYFNTADDINLAVSALTELAKN